MDTTFQKRVLEAAKRFLAKKGYDLLEGEGDEFDIVARDDEDLVFVDVRGKRRDCGKKVFPSAKFDHDDLEQRIADAIARNAGALVGFSIRYDTVSIVVINDDMTLIRHIKNAHGWNAAHGRSK